MDYIFTFLEGVASFISPCILPMLPIYLSYLMGSGKKKVDDKEVEKITTEKLENNISVNIKTKETKQKDVGLTNAIGFVIGFTITFVILSVFASLLGNLLNLNTKFASIILGLLIIILGISYMGLIPVHLKVLDKLHFNVQKFSFLNFATSILFGIVLSVTWIPCVGPFLSSALLLISKETNILKGILLILIYSLGLGLPFIISAILTEKLKDTFTFIKKHYNIVKKICGLILVIMGIYVMFK